MFDEIVWDELPNAKHITRILNDVAIHSERWNSVPPSSIPSTDIITLVDRGLEDKKMTIYYTVRYTINEHIPSSANGYAYTTVRNALLALIAFDDCAYLLDEDPEYVRTMAMLGNTAAILLSHACFALSKTI